MRGEREPSFADLWVPPSWELGWPVGVQEDDDVHWRWDPTPSAPGTSPAEGALIVDVVLGRGDAPTLVVERVHGRSWWRDRARVARSA